MPDLKSILLEERLKLLNAIRSRIEALPPGNCNTEIKIGSAVAYSVQFLKSIGASHTNLAHARGTVTGLKQLGNQILAVVDWNNESIPCKILSVNLAIVGPNSKFCNVG